MLLKLYLCLYLKIALTLLININAYTECSSLCDGIYDAIPKDKLGTKTGYFNSLKDQTLWKDYREESSGCTPIKIWLFTRHGSRYPVNKALVKVSVLPKISEELLYNHLHGRGCLNEEDVFQFKQWIPPYETRDKGELHSTGYDELFAIGEHWRNMFPQIFENLYNESVVKVEYTVRNRTGQSAYHFVRGVYGDDAIGAIKLPKPYSPNFLLRFYKSCPMWLRDVYRNEDKTYFERRLFEKGPEFQSTVEAISSRLGYIHPIPLEQIAVMYDECRYEAAWWAQKTSIWCKPFSKHDIEVLEYHQDLKYYYEDSYGTPMNKDMACKTISDLYSHFQISVLDNGSIPKAVVYISHDKAILKVQAALGLFKPREHLRHDNFKSSSERLFRSSKLVPFGSNLGFVLYRCGESHKVVLFFQGNPMIMANICDRVFCNWENVRQLIRPIYVHCDLTKTCTLHDEL